MNIGRRIYYDQTTGNVILDTGERSGSVIETTVDQDFEIYKALKERIRETVGIIELEYGQYAEDFATCNGYWIVQVDNTFSNIPMEVVQVTEESMILAPSNHNLRLGCTYEPVYINGESVIPDKHGKLTLPIDFVGDVAISGTQHTALQFSYPNPAEPEAPPVYQKPLSQRITELEQRNADLELAIADILIGGLM